MHSEMTAFPGNDSGHLSHHPPRAQPPEEAEHPLITAFIVITSVLIVISLITTVIRCYSRIRYSRAFSYEDYFAVSAFVFAIVLAVFSIWQMRYGIGAHINTRHDKANEPPPGTPFAVGFHNINATGKGTPEMPQPEPTWKMQLLLLTGPILSPMVHLAGVTLIRLSFLVFYRRLVPSNRFRAICMATIVFVIVSWLALMGALLFQCKPFWAMWHVDYLATAKCVKPEYLFLAIAVVSFVADVIVFILPIPVVIRSGLPKGQKIHVLCVFFLGIM
jgi:hypothetical protein